MINTSLFLLPTVIHSCIYCNYQLDYNYDTLPGTLHEKIEMIEDILFDHLLSCPGIQKNRTVK